MARPCFNVARIRWKLHGNRKGVNTNPLEMYYQINYVYETIPLKHVDASTRLHVLKDGLIYICFLLYVFPVRSTFANIYGSRTDIGKGGNTQSPEHVLPNMLFESSHPLPNVDVRTRLHVV